MAASTTIGVGLATLAPAVAQEGQALEVQKWAQYAHPVTTAAPNTATQEFPPGVVCLLFPQPCGEETAPIREPVTQGLNEVGNNEAAAPIQPTPPDGLTMSINAGEPRYVSAEKFKLLSVPSGKQVDSFVVTFQQDSNWTYHSESPAFRQAVLAAIAGAGSQDPEAFVTEFQKALEMQPVVTEQVMGLEMCPLTKPFEATSHPEARPYSEAPREKKGELAVDCLLGANGNYDKEAGTWSFDLTLAMQAWNEGELPKEGVLIRPTQAENLAYGDPDPSTNAQVVLVPQPTATITSSEPPAPVEGLGDFGDGGVGGGTTGSSGSQSFDSGASGGGFSSAPSGGSSGGSTFAQPPSSTSADEQPAVAPPAQSGAPTGGDATAQEPVAAGSQQPGSAWWVWLLVPTFLLGAYYVSQSLVAEAYATTTAGQRSGAMTRLIEKRRSGALGSGDSPVPV